MTPAGMTFSTLAGMAGGGLQTPGVMGVGKFYLTQPQVHLGRRRLQARGLDVVRSEGDMANELHKVAEREGDPDLLDKICRRARRHDGGRAAGLAGGAQPPGADHAADLLKAEG